MAKVALYNMDGKECGQIELKDEIFNVEVNTVVMHEVVVAHLANRRQGTQSAKTRAEVRGGGRKPYRQKGTGRARQGSIRSPQWVGGGVVFAPKPRDYSKKVNKKVRRIALKSALTSRVQEDKLIVLENLNLEEIKTKAMVGVLNNFNVEKALVVLDGDNQNVVLSARNIPNVKTVRADMLNVYDILKYETFVATKDAVAKIEEVYA
ncbi:50S ribosomal protein L4 [Bianquea renquensis]|jgi:50S ribosomal protein L4|uniref:Large ribosomal subunit protein uL4 n=1 Tax=Bianquea renquensis TaxID=2763661 RepID=A0A926DTZ6_9FIRM|nr:50S ribosomal protein L4 [Bianquea renquensis]MBC8543255.1 50S ribosomal protein L4 [Bianquea renquensis]